MKKKRQRAERVKSRPSARKDIRGGVTVSKMRMRRAAAVPAAVAPRSRALAEGRPARIGVISPAGRIVDHDQVQLLELVALSALRK